MFPIPAPSGPNLGVPSFIYAMQKGLRLKQQYSVKDIKLAIYTFTSGDFENLSDSTLEANLDVVYYPKHLRHLVNPRLTSAIFGLFVRYLEAYLVGHRSCHILLLVLI